MGVGSCPARAFSRWWVLPAAVALLLAACAPQEPAPGPAGQDPESPEAQVTEPGGEQMSGLPRLEPVGTFDRPVYVTAPPDDERIFVVEQAGRVVQLTGGEVFLDITDGVGCCGERGLLSIAFAPDYAESGLVYASYTNRSGDSVIDEYRVDGDDPNRIDPDSRRQILQVSQPFGNHNGGLIKFDPTGMLMVGLGDGGSGGDPGNRAQDLGTLLGKLLRIDPRSPTDGRQYSIPRDNPFIERQGARPEIWAYGLRNPWRWSFDEDGNLFVADVGQQRVEEVNFVPPAAQAGANYGWRKYEGDEVFRPGDEIDESQLIRPVFTYPNARGDCSVTGGGVYRGSVTALRGYYLFGDFCGGVLRGFRVDNGRAVDARTFDDLSTRDLSSFGVDAQGEMYVVSLAGEVFRISAD